MGNIGDSRAILSKNNGKTTICLTRDHKPSDEIEKKRIIESGGRVYQYNSYNLGLIHLI
jgi:serine/threonine protein phosphatase PrpC